MNQYKHLIDKTADMLRHMSWRGREGAVWKTSPETERKNTVLCFSKNTSFKFRRLNFSFFLSSETTPCRDEKTVFVPPQFPFRRVVYACDGPASVHCLHVSVYLNALSLVHWLFSYVILYSHCFFYWFIDLLIYWHITWIRYIYIFIHLCVYPFHICTQTYIYLQNECMHLAHFECLIDLHVIPITAVSMISTDISYRYLASPVRLEFTVDIH